MKRRTLTLGILALVLGMTSGEAWADPKKKKKDKRAEKEQKRAEKARRKGHDDDDDDDDFDRSLTPEESRRRIEIARLERENRELRRQASLTRQRRETDYRELRRQDEIARIQRENQQRAILPRIFTD